MIHFGTIVISPDFAAAKSGKCRLSSCQLISWDGDPSATRNSEIETLSIGKQAISYIVNIWVQKTKGFFQAPRHRTNCQQTNTMLWACNMDRRWIDTQDTQYTGLDYSTQFWNLRSRTMHKFHWKKACSNPISCDKTLVLTQEHPWYIYIY